ncbi:TPA: PTS mannose/fructose/sorbose transporter subunit IIB, partial [Streptococcus pyogenes]|nr:PTS mannose/fructose/sorbose transporter subunit IIB [Streptococcus pyogenes]
VNVANVGRFDKSDPACKVKVTPSLLLNPEEMAAAKELVSLPELDVFNQVLPSNTKVHLSQLVN